MTDLTITKDVMINARNIIDKYGHARGTYRSGDTGAYCTYGAIIVALHSGDVPERFGGFLPLIGDRVARLFGAQYSGEILIWNDVSTKEEVLETFDKVIANMPDEAVPT